MPSIQSNHVLYFPSLEFMNSIRKLEIYKCEGGNSVDLFLRIYLNLSNEASL